MEAAEDVAEPVDDSLSAQGVGFGPDRADDGDDIVPREMREAVARSWGLEAVVQPRGQVCDVELVAG